MAEERKWYQHPQGWVATATVVTMVLSFFYVRERQLWELNARITALEARGQSAISRADIRLDKMDTTITATRDRVSDHEYRISTLERK